MADDNRKGVFVMLLDPDTVFESWWATALEDAQLSENDEACMAGREPESFEGEPAADYLQKYKADVAAMCIAAEPLLQTLNLNEYPKGKGGYSLSEAFGSDLYMTAVGHGVGFWDGDWSDIGDDLTTLTKRHITGGDLAEHIGGGFFFL